MADKTLTILFTEDAVYGSVPPEKFARGAVVTMREDLAMRWVRRGMATQEFEPAKGGRPATPIKKVVKLPPGVPENWRDLDYSRGTALAISLGAAAESVPTLAHARAYIDGKVEEFGKAPEKAANTSTES